jgi:hypothetical protein
VFCHVIVSIFKVHDIIKVFLDSFDLFEKIIPYVKDEGFNLNTLSNALTTVVSCVPF